LDPSAAPGHVVISVRLLHLLTKSDAEIFIQSGDIDIFQNSRWRPCAILNLSRQPGDYGTLEGALMVHTPVKNFVIFGLVVFKL